MRSAWMFSLVVFAMSLSPVPAHSSEPARQLRLMTYNLNFGNANVNATLDAIADGNADVVLLQEITSQWRDALRKRFGGTYPHQAYHLHTRGAGGIAVISKLELTAHEIWPAPPGGAWFPAQRIVIAAPFGALQILNVHLRPAWDGGWVRGFMTTPPVRRQEIEAHWQQLDRALPTIVAGDFNEDDTGLAIEYLTKAGLSRVPTTGPRSWRYEHTTKGMTTELLKMDIDHVMIDGSLVARGGQVLDAGTSDHRPVVVTIHPK